MAGFSVVPLILGLTAVALLGRRRQRAALVAGPAPAVGPILGMTVPAGFDTTSTVTLPADRLRPTPGRDGRRSGTRDGAPAEAGAPSRRLPVVRRRRS